MVSQWELDFCGLYFPLLIYYFLFTLDDAFILELGRDLNLTFYFVYPLNPASWYPSKAKVLTLLGSNKFFDGLITWFNSIVITSMSSTILSFPRFADTVG